MRYTGTVYRGVHQYLQKLPPGVIIPSFPELTDEQAKNPLYFDYHDFDKRAWSFLSDADKKYVLSKSPSIWIHNNCVILDKKEKLIPFKWNKEQWIMFFVLREFWRRGLPVRLVVLKGRQFGSTTFWVSIFYWRMENIRNSSGLILAHKEKTSISILNKIHRFHKHNPNATPTEVKSRKEIRLKDSESQIVAGTGHGTSEGIGETNSAVLGEEVARWPDGGALAGGLFQSSSRSPNSMIILNSTARGWGNYFHKTWQESKSPDSEIKGIFLPFNIHEEYSYDFHSRDEEAKFCITLSAAEKSIQEQYNLSNGQLHWRRARIKELAGADDPEGLFRENYPLSDTEAFLSSSSNYFDSIKLHDVLEELRARHKINKPKRGGMSGSGKNWRFEEFSGGRMEVYELPRKNSRYVVSGDISLGVKDGDYTSIDVVEIDTFTQVATCHGLMEEKDQIEFMQAIAWFYNNALIACENNYNPYVARQIAREYNNCYFYKKTGSKEERAGWNTNSSTRMSMLSGLREVINRDLLTINCKETIEEMLGFGFDGVKIQAQDDMHDDRVISMAIAVAVARERFKRGMKEVVQMGAMSPKGGFK